MYDYHLHTDYSKDSTTSMERIINAAIKKGFREIAFTDHYEIETYHLGKYGTFIYDYDKYSEEIQKLSEKYKDKIIIRKGIEIGATTSNSDAYDKILKREDIDFIIASVHASINRPVSESVYFDGISLEQGYEGYLLENLQIAKKLHNYNVIGHLDYIRRYHQELKTIEYKNYEEIFRELFRYLIENGKGIEVNTCTNGVVDCIPSFELIKLYLNMGGEIITIGSDAHSEANFGRNIPFTIKRLQEIGVKYLCTFKNKSAIFNKI